MTTIDSFEAAALAAQTTAANRAYVREWIATLRPKLKPTETYQLTAGDGYVGTARFAFAEELARFRANRRRQDSPVSVWLEAERPLPAEGPTTIRIVSLQEHRRNVGIALREFCAAQRVAPR